MAMVKKGMHPRKSPGAASVATTGPPLFLLDEIRLIGAASAIGAVDKGCATAPYVLKRLRLERILAEHGLNVKWEAILRPEKNAQRERQLSVAKAFLTEVADRVADVLVRDLRFAVVGGDHSCAIGTWSGAVAALRQRGPLGLLWVDAHMDSHTPDTSPSGALHGMPLACLLGHGERELTEIACPGPKLQPQHVCIVGVRSFEEGEARLLQLLGVRIFLMQEVQRIGLEAVMQQAIEIVSQETAAFGISIDVDAIDPQDAPGVGTPAPLGVAGRDLAECMGMVARQPKLVGLEVTEFNPLRDVNERTAKLVCDLLAAGFRVPRRGPPLSDISLGQ
ncbi:MAG: arginase [Gammaproteobacteria bacterium]